MKPLNYANDLLGHEGALNTAFNRDGYLFFRDVLPEFRSS